MNITATEAVIESFPGQLYDTETGMHYNHHRYYSPEVGRYLRADPIGMRGGLNYYIYGNSNPLMWTDVSGAIGNIVEDPKGSKNFKISLEIVLCPCSGINISKLLNNIG